MGKEYKVDISEAGGHRGDSLQYKHPSYGMIGVYRYSGGDGQFFGSDLDHNSGIRIEVHHAELTQNLGSNWYYGHNKIVEVEMSAVQYAEMISNPNTEGVPCTIKYEKEHGYIQYAPPMSKEMYVEGKIKEKAQDVQNKARTVADQVKELLSGKILAADRAEIIELVSSFAGDLNSTLPFYLKSLQEEVDRTKMEAKADVQAMLLHEVTKAGYEAIQAGDKVFKLGELKTLEEKE